MKNQISKRTSVVLCAIAISGTLFSTPAIRPSLQQTQPYKCAASGQLGVCCDDSGSGPYCGLADTGQCGEGTTKQNSCQINSSSPEVYCPNSLSALPSAMEFLVRGKGEYVTIMDWTYFFMSTAQDVCGPYNCELGYINYGLSMESNLVGAKIKFKPDCTQCSKDQFENIQMRCMVNGAPIPTTSQNTNLQLKEVCWVPNEFSLVSSPQNTSFSFLLNSQSGSETNVQVFDFSATDYFQRPLDSCGFYMCTWRRHSGIECSTITESYAETQHVANQDDYQTKFSTSNLFTQRNMCLTCQTRDDTSTEYRITSSVVTFEVNGCSQITEVANVTSSYQFGVANPNDPVQNMTLFDGHANYFKMMSGYEQFAANCLLPTSIKAYRQYQVSEWDPIMNQKTYRLITAELTSDSLVSINNTSGQITIQLSNLYRYSVVFILVRAAGYYKPSIKFSIITTCGQNSTTISAPLDLLSQQIFKIDTEQYLNDNQKFGKRPTFEFSPFVSSNQDCLIEQYDIQASQSNITKPDNLTMIYNSATQKHQVSVNNSLNFTINNYTFTIKATADGGAFVYQDMQLFVDFPCEYDNIQIVDQVPEDHVKALDMSVVSKKVQVLISGTVGSMDLYQIELQDLFKHNSSQYCQLQQYRIYRVLNHSTGVNIDIDQNRMEIDANSGQWTLKDLSTVYMNVSVFIQAFNGFIWSDTVSQPLLLIDIYPNAQCMVTELKLDGLNGPISNIKPVSSNPLVFNYDFINDEKFEFTFDATVVQIPPCDEMLAFPQMIVTASTNELVPTNQKQLPDIFKFDQFQNKFEVNLPTNNLTQANLYLGSYTIEATVYPKSNEEVVLNILSFKLIILQGQVSENQQQDKDEDQAQNQAMKYGNILQNQNQKQHDITLSNNQTQHQSAIALQQDNQNDIKPVKILYDEITRDGILVLKFNQKLIVPTDQPIVQNLTANKTNLLRLLQQTTLQQFYHIQFDDVFRAEILGLESSKIIDQDDDEQNEETTVISQKNNTQLDPEIIEWSESHLSLSLNFTEPLQLSRTASGKPVNYLQLDIINTGYFVSQDSQVELQSSEIPTGLTIIIPRQLPKGTQAQQIVDTATNNRLTLQIIIILAAIFLKAGSQRLIILIMAIQLVAYFPLYKVDMPAELEIYIEALRQIAEFDILPTKQIYEFLVQQEFINSDNESSKSLEVKQIEQENNSAGFKSFNPFQNIFGFLIIICAVSLFIILVVPLALIKKLREKVLEKLKQFKEKMIWSGIIKSIMLTYLKNFVAFILACKLMFIDEIEGQTLSISILLGLILVVFPIGSYLFLIKNIDNLQSEEFLKKFGGLYSDLKQNLLVHSTSVLLFPLIFSLRRASFVVVSLIEFPTIILNLIFLIVLSIVYLAWLEEVKPFQLRKNHYLETANELLILFLCYHMICFTDLTDLQSQIEEIQPSFIYTFVLMIALNLVALIVDVFSPYKLKRWWQMRQAIRQQSKKRLADDLIRIKVKKTGKIGQDARSSESVSESSNGELSSSVSQSDSQPRIHVNLNNQQLVVQPQTTDDKMKKAYARQQRVLDRLTNFIKEEVEIKENEISNKQQIQATQQIEQEKKETNNDSEQIETQNKEDDCKTDQTDPDKKAGTVSKTFKSLLIKWRNRQQLKQQSQTQLQRLFQIRQKTNLNSIAEESKEMYSSDSIDSGFDESESESSSDSESQSESKSDIPSPQYTPCKSESNQPNHTFQNDTQH